MSLEPSVYPKLRPFVGVRIQLRFAPTRAVGDVLGLTAELGYDMEHQGPPVLSHVTTPPLAAPATRQSGTAPSSSAPSGARRGSAAGNARTTARTAR
jgi:hypothetical protein